VQAKFDEKKKLLADHDAVLQATAEKLLECQQWQVQHKVREDAFYHLPSINFCYCFTVIVIIITTTIISGLNEKTRLQWNLVNHNISNSHRMRLSLSTHLLQARFSPL